MKATTLTLALLLMLASPLVHAQVTDTTSWHVHLSTGLSVSNGFGRTLGNSWLATDVELHPTQRLTVNTGFANIGSVLPQDYKLHGLGPRSLTPRREGTQATAVWAEAEYQVNDKLWLWAAVAHIGGFAQPLWLDHSLPLNATAFQGGFGYRFGENSVLEMHMHIVHDNYGTLAPLLYHDPFYHYRFF